jgi:pentatricopeptide repeat-containing protein PET309
MLERKAGCLESGSLRRLLSGSQKTVKSRRTLHSGFWNHGALDLELSPLWSALVRGPNPGTQTDDIQQQTPATTHAGFLLDFLYPAGTINFLRQYSSWGVDRHDGRRTIIGLGRVGQRLYTSSAKDSSAAEELKAAAATDKIQEPVTIEETTTSDGSVSEGGLSIEKLRRLFQLESSDYEEAWRLFGSLDELKKKEVQHQLIQYLSSSGRVVHAERITDVFEKLEKGDGDRDADACALAVRSYLRLRNLSDAVTLYEEAVESFQFPAGASDLMSYMMNNSLWSRAFNFWKTFESFKAQAPGLSYNIFEIIENRPVLAGQAIELAEYANKRMESSTGSPELVDFASNVVTRALWNAAADESRFPKLLSVLQGWDRDTVEIYEKAIEGLFASRKSKLAVSLYRQARKERQVKFSRPTLHNILSIFCSNHSVLGMQQVLDDFFSYYSGPSRTAYRKCMIEFASQGDSATVHALFEQYVTKYKVLNVNDLAPILHVHARRGETSEVFKYFNQIEEVYALKPDLLCWNILVDAYAKVHDADGAFEAFERILELENIHPDHYTFGTIMGIYTTRGDLDRVKEVYQLALTMDREQSCAMVDCLVLAHIQDERLEQAEKICEDALDMDLIGSRTRMWSYLIIGHAMNRDLVNVNRILRRMSKAKIDYDQFTYSAMMQALAMTKQVDSAYAILKETMRDAGLKVTSFHYAVVMGGFYSTGEYRKVFEVHNRMLRRELRQTASTRLLAMKTAEAEDRKLYLNGTEKQKGQRALEMFQEVIKSMDAQDISVTPQKFTNRQPRHIAYPTMMYSFVMGVLGSSNEFETVEDLLQQFVKILPEDRQESLPVEIFSVVMKSRMTSQDPEGVQKCWDLAVAQARAQGQPLPSLRVVSRCQPDDSTSDSTSVNSKIVPIHQYDLARPLSTYMETLNRQQRVDDIPAVVNGLLEEGFLLDSRNWNQYIQYLSRRYRYKLAFELCEENLIENWQGWARIRWQLPVRNRLPMAIRNKKKKKSFLRPTQVTLAWLARAFLDLQAMAAESKASQILLDDLHHECPRTLNAIKTMQRTDANWEREILGDY